MRKSKTSKKYIFVSAIVCPDCKSIVFSRADHDYRSCFCGNVAKDGGFSYSRIAFKNKMPKVVKIKVEATREELYNDWNTKADKFGIIKAK